MRNSSNISLPIVGWSDQVVSRHTLLIDPTEDQEFYPEI